MKARASFTIETDVLAKLDAVVDNITYKSKSEAVEDILRKSFERQRTAVILCGGNFLLEGTDIYRPLVKVNGTTVIENTLNILRLNGFRNIFVSGKSDLLKNVFRLIRNGEGYGVDVKYIDDNAMNGSAKALERIKQYIGATTIFIPGDAVFDIDLKDMVKSHIMHNGVASIAVYMTHEQPEETKDKIVIKGNRVVGFEKLSSVIKSKLIPTSILTFEPDVFKYIPPGEMAWDIKGDLLPLLAKDGLLFSYIYEGNWIHVKKREDIEKAKQIMLKR